jgi:DNA-binding transcriptional regulator YiaG
MNQLRTLRNAANLSVPELASELGVKPVTVYAWEAGRNAVSVPAAKDILRVLALHGVQSTLDELFNDCAESERAA